MRFNDLRRREFITVLGGAAAMWPLVSRAQQPAMPLIGVLQSGSRISFETQLAAFHQGLAETGYVEGRNVAIEHRWADGQYDRLPGLAAELVRRQVTLIFAGGGVAPAKAAMAATNTIPIIFLSGTDPIDYGLVTSLSRPGGNITGISWFASALEAKRLGLLHEVAPSAANIAVLVNPDFPAAENQLKEARAAAREHGLNIVALSASATRELDTIFATLLDKRADALLVSPDPSFYDRREQLVALATRHAVPTIYYEREFIVAGGLMSYGTSLRDAFRLAGIYSGRILKGEKPADLPVLQPTKFEFVINLKNAKALGLTVPPTLLATADEVIE
jgi:putative ABC transport system substrate-binding protein